MKVWLVSVRPVGALPPLDIVCRDKGRARTYAALARKFWWPVESFRPVDQRFVPAKAFPDAGRLPRWSRRYKRAKQFAARSDWREGYGSDSWSCST